MSAPLSIRSPNASPSKAPKNGKVTEAEEYLRSFSNSPPKKTSKPTSDMDTQAPTQTQPPQLLKEDGPKQQTYISPSDTILSPATRKISALKGKRFANAAAVGVKSKNQSLFAKTSVKNAKASSLAREGVKAEEVEWEVVEPDALGRDIPTSAPKVEEREA